MIRLFVPILAGATLRDRALACVGGVVGILVTSTLSWMLLHDLATLPLLVAPMGASAVLVFAVPASPLAQPWPVIGGNMVSALVGVGMFHLVPNIHIAAGLAVGAAILAMSLLRCLHPPGGAAALTAVIGGPVVTAAGWLFPFAPVAINAGLLVLAGVAYHRLSGHSYPHRAVPVFGNELAERGLAAPHPEDISAALNDLGETFDISSGDLELLIRRVDYYAAQRRSPPVRRISPEEQRRGVRTERV